MIFMSSEENASLDPAGEVFELQVDVNDRFEEPFHSTAFIVEARHGDVLTQAPLWELYRNSKQLLEMDEFLNHFSLLKSREKLAEQDKIWKLICKDLKWQYIKTI